MICRICGASLNDGASFCKNCGASLATQPIAAESQQQSKLVEPHIGKTPPTQAAKKTKNSETMKTVLIVLGAVISLAVAGFVVYFFLGNDYGAKKLFDGTEVYYKKPVTEKEAEKFGKYLVETGFTDGSTKTVQLLKEGDTYQVRMVQRKGVQIDAIYSDLFKEMAKKLSEDVFRKAPVVIHLCDDKLKTTKVIKMTYLTNNVDALEENPNEMTNAEEAVSTVEHTADSYYATTKTYFYNGPEDSKKNRKYLVEGDVLPALSFQNGFIYTVFTNEKGIITKGWLIIEDLKPNTIFGYWEIRPKDDVEGYGFPSLSLEADGTATYQSSDDWGYSGTYDFNGNNVVFTGKPYGDNADGTEPLEKFTFNVRDNYLIGNSTTFIRR